MPDLPFAITKHPIGGLRPPLVVEKAVPMAAEVARTLTGGAVPEPSVAGD
jgi:hypothetical protein